MSYENGSGRKDTEGRGSTGMNVLFGVSLAVLAMFLVGNYLLKLFTFELPVTDLLELAQVTQLEKATGELRTESPGYIDVDQSARGKTGGVLRISNLRRVAIDDRSVQGIVQIGQLVSVGAKSAHQEVDPKTLQKERRFITYVGKDDAFRKDLEAAFAKHNIIVDNGPGPSALDAAAPYLISGGLMVLLVYFLIKRLVGAGSPMQFGRSKGKLYAQEDLGVTFNDVAGIDEAVEEVREVVDFLRSPEKYQRLGGRIPKGVLLVGPPGTGKTLLAKAIAGEAGVPFFSLSGSDFVEMFVGVGAARVRDMFQQAESKAPCIIFIDELDALGKSRGNGHVGGGEEREQTLNALLVEMDGFDSNSGVIVMAATNRPETLDQALLRGGRFDRHVLVDRPDIRGREDILKVHVKNVKLDPNVELKSIAGITPGLVGADLANLVNEAALLAARAGKNSVGMREFHEAVERVTAGLEKKQRVMCPDEKLRVAYHESGHALVAYSLPNTDPVHKVSIIPRGIAALGYTMQRPEGDRFLVTQSELESEIQVLLGGTITEEIVFSDISTGATNDLQRATEIARNMVMRYGMSRLGRVNYKEGSRSAFLIAAANDEPVRMCSEQTLREIDQEVRRLIDEAVDKVRHILEVRKPTLEALTKRLMEVESIDADEFKRIMEETSPGPLVVPGTLPPKKPGYMLAKEKAAEAAAGQSQAGESVG